MTAQVPAFGNGTRRGVLRHAAVAASAALLPGCATTAAGALTRAGQTCAFDPVDVAADRVIRSVVGLRPYRASGFVVRAEQLGDKTIVHNYGHGGGGITLSWGSSRLAVDLVQGHPARRAVVLGAGIMGLTTARLLQEAGMAVTIHTAALPPYTTSNIAGGQWYPSLVFDGDALTPSFERQLVAAAAYSYRRFQTMVGARYGVRWMTNYELTRRPRGPGRTDRLIAAMMPEAHAVPPGAHPFGDHHVRQYRGLMIETPIFLRQLLEDFRIAGGTVELRQYTDPAQLAALPEELIFNCTGLGAAALFGDDDLIPLAGQLEILLPQPEVDYAYTGPGGIYMFSRSDGIILGGTADPGATDTTPDPAIGRAIVDAHQELMAGFGCVAA